MRCKYCSAQPYLDYIGVSEKERKEWNKEEEIKSKCCGVGIYYLQSDFFVPWEADGRPYCRKCRKPTEIRGEEFECFVCNRKIENSLKNRVTVVIEKTSFIPKTWGICDSCRQLKLRRLK